MKAITLWRPWSDAIVRGPKRVENRTWPPPRALLGRRIAIHAGLKYDECFSGDINWEDAPDEDGSPTGVVGTARLIGALDCRDAHRPPRVIVTKESETTLVRTRLRFLQDDPWWSGPVGWLLGAVTAIDSVPCRGAQGLWDLPGDVEREVIRRAVLAK